MSFTYNLSRWFGAICVIRGKSLKYFQFKKISVSLRVFA